MDEKGLAAAIGQGEAGKVSGDAPAAEQLALLPPAETAKRGPGRPPGASNKATLAWRDLILSRHRSPLEVLAEIMETETDELARRLYCKRIEALGVRVRAAEALLPYLHKKLPVEIAGAGEARAVLIIEGAAGEYAGELDDLVSLVPIQRNQPLSGAEPAQSDGGQSDSEAEHEADQEHAPYARD